MVEGPDLDKAVFVRCLGLRRSGRSREDYGLPEDDMDEAESSGTVEVSCGFVSAGASSDPGDRGFASRGEERTVQMRRGDIWIVRWRSVREAVARGECELL